MSMGSKAGREWADGRGTWVSCLRMAMSVSLVASCALTCSMAIAGAMTLVVSAAYSSNQTLQRP